MKAEKTKTPQFALIEGLGGLFLFLVALVLLRYVSDNTSWPVFDGFVGVLFANAPLIVIFIVLFTIGEVLFAFPFPINLASPVFNAVAVMMLVFLILKILEFLDRFYALGTGGALGMVEIILLPLTLFVVLVSGYLFIFASPERAAGPTLSGKVSDGEKNDIRKSLPRENIFKRFRLAVADAVQKVRNGMK